MNKQDVLREYRNQEDRIFIGFILDKINFVSTRNKIEHTNFLSMNQIALAENFLKRIKYTNYKMWGGFDNAERKVLILYPEKLNETMIAKNYNKIMGVIRIKLPETEYGKYSHRNYLGGIIKLGLDREKIGDILVENDGADIIVINDTKKFLIKELPMLKRFEYSNISDEKIENLNCSEPNIEEIKIIVPSLRLDNFVSDLARTSRNKAIEIIRNERVFINGKVEVKISKQVKIEDIITIRGKGRFVVKDIEGTTRSGRSIVSVSKYM